MDAAVKTDWYVYQKRADFSALAKRFSIDPVTARIIRNRDVVGEDEIDRYLNGSLEDLYDESLLPDLDAAAACIIDAAVKKKKIMVVGDYDIDGVCATYILCDGLRRMGAEVSHAIPDRVKDGYGISMAIVDMAIGSRTDILITCDNGIAALDELKKRSLAA